MPIRRITIIGCDTSTQSLRLAPPFPRFEPGVTVIWEIGPQSGVDSIISIVEKSEGSDNIWSVAPHYQDNHWTGRVKNPIAECSLFAYSINWKKDGITYAYDPIIAIKSSKRHKTDSSLITGIVSLVSLFAFSLMFWQKQKRNK